MKARSWLRQAATRVRSQVRSANDGNATVNASGGANVPAQVRAPLPARSWFRRRTEGERSRWARRALDWPLVNWLEGAIWLGVAVTLGISYYGSWDNLVLVLLAAGYANGPASVVPVAIDAPLTVSVIGQFLLARWKSPAPRRWRLFVVTLVTAPLTLAGNALRGAVAVDGHGHPYLELALLDLHRLEAWIRLVAAMVPGIGIILAVAVAELVLRERARLEELRGAVRDADDEAADATQERELALDPPAPTSPRRDAKRVDPRALRVARAGGDWRKVAAATGLGEHGAKRALTAARKQLAAESQGASEEKPRAAAEHDGTASRPWVITSSGAAPSSAPATQEA